MTLRDLMNWERPFGIPVQQGGPLMPSFTSLQEEINRLFEHLYKGTEMYMPKWDK